MNLNLSNLRNKESNEAEDLGFGTKITGDKTRLIAKNGSYNIERKGQHSWTPYQDLVEVSWKKFFLVVMAFYALVNVPFAVILFFTGQDCLKGMADNQILSHFADAYFFSVQTFTTVGYGAVSPSCFSSNVVAAFIALTGLMTLALATGLFYARFSRPVSQIMFSKNAIIAPYREGLTSFQFRIANRRHNQLINAEAKVTMSWVEDDGQGGRKRRFARLPLELDKVMMLSLNWTIVHPIDENSPLFGKTPKDLDKMNLEVITLIEAYDETYAQTVLANSSYCDEEVIWNVRFKPMYYPGADGKTILDLDAIDEVIPA